MGWMGWIAVLVLAWLLADGVGWHGGGVLLVGGVAAALIQRLGRRLSETEQRLQQQVDVLQAELKMLRQGALPAAEAVAGEGASEPIGTVPASAPDESANAAALPPSVHDMPPEAAAVLPATAIAASPPPVAEAAAPHEVDERSIAVTTSLGASLLTWAKGGNTIVRVAVLILFIGVAFLLRYAAEHTTVPIEFRLAGVALGGLALAGLGFRLTPRRRGYGLSLQGAGVGIVYLVLFAAFRLYDLVPGGLSFALLAALAAITALLAVRQDALPLAVLGFGGGFLAPVLASTGQGNHVGLFGYYLLLNLAIAWIANRQSWKLLNLVGFLFSFGIGGLWGMNAYTPEKFASTEPFLIAHFLLYLYIAVQYTRRLVRAGASEEAPALPLVDGGLLFGVPLAAFGLQAAMLQAQPLALAASAAVMSAIYLAVGRWLWRQAGERMLLLVEGLLALGVVFLALVTPLALDARWTGVAWAIQGAGIVWIGLRQQRWWAVGMGLLLQYGAALSYWGSRAQAGDARPFANGDFLAAGVLALAAAVSARLLLRHADPASRRALPRAAGPLHALMLGLALLQAWAGGWLELDRVPPGGPDEPGRAALLAAVFVIGLEILHRPLRWPALRWPARGLLLFALLCSLAGTVDSLSSISSAWNRYAAGFGLLEAAGLVALGLWLAHRLDRPEPARWRSGEHVAVAGYALLQSGVFVYVIAAHFIARHEGWTPAAALVPPTLIALALLPRAAAARWPLAGSPTVYAWALFRPWALLLALWVLAVNLFVDGGMAPLPYLPLLNPLDLAHGLVLIYLLRLARTWPWPSAAGRVPAVVGAALAFWWLDAMLVRTLHAWAGTPMWLDGALDSALVQTGLTLLWTLTALLTMLFATRRARPSLARPLWIAGAALLGVVVLKLFLVDLSNVGTLARIVSFLAVGGLMLVIGYVSPLPPAAAARADLPGAAR